MDTRTHQKYQKLLDFCKELPPTKTAVAHPCDESSLRGAVDAANLKLINPILVGPSGALAVDCKARIAPRPPGPGPLFPALRRRPRA